MNRLIEIRGKKLSFLYANSTFDCDFISDDYIKMPFSQMIDKEGKKLFLYDIVKSDDNKIGVVIFSKEIGSCGCCYEEFDGAGFLITTFYEKIEALNPSNCKKIGNALLNKEFEHLKNYILGA